MLGNIDAAAAAHAHALLERDIAARELLQIMVDKISGTVVVVLWL